MTNPVRLEIRDNGPGIPDSVRDRIFEPFVTGRTGGTGLGSRDRTVEAITPLIDKEMPGFGELFRMVSFTDQVGTAAILSRALAGGVNGKLVVSMPGSKAAVELALTRVLLPELRHVMRELRR